MSPEDDYGNVNVKRARRIDPTACDFPRILSDRLWPLFSMNQPTSTVDFAFLKVFRKRKCIHFTICHKYLLFEWFIFHQHRISHRFFVLRPHVTWKGFKEGSRKSRHTRLMLLVWRNSSLLSRIRSFIDKSLFERILKCSSWEEIDNNQHVQVGHLNRCNRLD